MVTVAKNTLEVIDEADGYYLYGKDQEGQEVFIGSLGADFFEYNYGRFDFSYDPNTDTDLIEAYGIEFTTRYHASSKVRKMLEAIAEEVRIFDKVGYTGHKVELPAYAWLGGYPMYYVDSENSVLCAECATENALDEGDTSWDIVDYDVYEEGPDMYCDECGKVIESAYGDPWAEGEEDNA